MAYRVLSRFYSDSDQLGESFVLKSDNSELPIYTENGTMVRIVPLCDRKCGRDGIPRERGVFVCDECWNQ